VWGAIADGSFTLKSILTNSLTTGLHMNNSKSSLLPIFIGIIAVIVVAIGALVVSCISAYNLGNRLETTLKATYSNNQNILAQYSQKVMEASQVPTIMRDDIVKVAKSAIEGRYGEGGSKAVLQAIVESNPQVDPAVYRQIQQIIEGGRNEFQSAQTRLIDQKRVYEEALGSFWTGMWLRIAGYPKVNLVDYKIITTDRTESVFKAGKEEAPLQLRPASP
jgi:hypothetical protein